MLDSVSATAAPAISRRADGVESKTDCAVPNVESNRRAISPPTPGVWTNRSHAANSSSSITMRRDASGRSASGLREAVADLDRYLRVQDQSVRNPVEDPEHEQHTVTLVWQLDLGAN